MCDNEEAMGNTQAEDKGKPPKRRRRRWLLVIPAIVLAIAIAWVVWAVLGTSALRREVEAIRARGEPLAWADLASEPVPDEQNAAELYRKAGEIAGQHEQKLDEALSAAAEGKDPGQRLDISHLDRAEVRRRYAAEVSAFLAGCEDALELARRARQMSRSDWKIDYSRPAILWELPPLSEHRCLSRALSLAALSAHDAGDDASAVEYLRDGLAQARSAREMPILIGYLSAAAEDSLTLSTIEQVVPTLRVGEAPPAAARSQVAALRDDLLAGEASVREGFLRAMMGERCYVFDSFERLRSGQIWPGALEMASPGETPRPGLFARLLLGVGGPLLRADEVRALRYMTAMVEGARAETFPESKDAWPTWRPESFWDRISRPVSSMLLPTLERLAILHFRDVAMRRMTATAVAIRLYQIDHGGRRPGKLADLVPKHLPAVPSDPFARDGRPLGYLPRADRPILYSVDENGADDGGAFEVALEGHIDLDESGDLPFFLDGNRPYRRPSTQPAASQPAEPR